MIEEPERYAEQFKMQAHILTVHIEACRHLHRNIQQIKSLGMKAGVALNPAYPCFFPGDVLHDIDLVCMMSVNPGFGGQNLFPIHWKNKKQLHKIINDRG